MTIKLVEEVALRIGDLSQVVYHKNMKSFFGLGVVIGVQIFTDIKIESNFF